MDGNDFVIRIPTITPRKHNVFRDMVTLSQVFRFQVFLFKSLTGGSGADDFLLIWGVCRVIGRNGYFGPYSYMPEILPRYCMAVCSQGVARKQKDIDRLCIDCETKRK